MTPCRPEDLLWQWRALGWPTRAAPRLGAELAGGRSNRSYLINAGEARWVLRLDAPDAAALGVDRAREHRIQRIAAAAGLAPALIAADVARGYSLSVFIDGEQASATTLDDARQHALHGLLSALHRLDTGLAPFDYWHHACRLRAVSVHDAEGAAFRARIERLHAAAPAGLCHHDVVPANVVFVDGRAVLLDWEYAAHGLPVFDYAALVVDWSRDVNEVSAACALSPALLREAVICYRELCTWWAARQAKLAQL